MNKAIQKILYGCGCYDIPHSLSKGQFSKFCFKQKIITMSFYFLDITHTALPLNDLNTLTWSNKTFAIIQFTDSHHNRCVVQN